MRLPTSKPSGSTPQVTVVIPAYNVSAYIAQALGSVRAQTFRDFETIVINDGSRDSADLERTLEPYRNEIMYVSKPNGGPASARNAGIEIARAPLIAFLDADDIWEPNFLQMMVTTFERYPHTDVVYSNALLFSGTEVGNKTLMDLFPTRAEVTFGTILSGEAWVFCCCMVRKETLIEIGKFDPQLRYAEDLDLWLRIAHAGGQFVPVSEPLVRYRRRSGSITASIGDSKGNRARVAVYEGLINKLNVSPDNLRAMHLAIGRYKTANAGVKPRVRELKVWAKKVLAIKGSDLAGDTRCKSSSLAVGKHDAHWSPRKGRPKSIHRIVYQTDLSILVVSYYFPPNAAVGGRRVARFCKYLPDFGIRPIVLTIDEESCGAADFSLPSSAQLQIERARPRTTLLERYNRWADLRGVVHSPNNGSSRLRFAVLKHVSSLRNHVLALLQFPDRQRGWYGPAIKAANRITSNFQIDVVLSSGPPWTGHKVAYSISRQRNIPWIADFRDSWTSDPWSNYIYGPKGAPAWRVRLDRRTEYRWLRHARIIVCTTNQHRECLLRSNPDLDPSRVVIIPNGFEYRPDSLRSPAGSGPRRFLHAGNLYAERRIGTFCRALESLVRRGRLSPDMASITLIGDVDRDIERDARDSAPDLFASGMITLQPRIDWEKAQQATREADVLLIFQGHHPTAIPAKFYEYMQTGKPIVAIAGRGALRDIVLQTGSGFVADPDDQTEIESVLEQSLQAEPRRPDEVQRIAEQFDFRKLTANLAQSIRDAVKL